MIRVSVQELGFDLSVQQELLFLLTLSVPVCVVLMHRVGIMALILHHQELVQPEHCATIGLVTTATGRIQ